MNQLKEQVSEIFNKILLEISSPKYNISNSRIRYMRMRMKNAQKK